MPNDDKTPKEAIAEAEAQGHTPVNPSKVAMELVAVTYPDTYFIVKQKDGNWKGYGNVHGNPVEVRDIGPETVLQRLLTHP